MLVVGALRVEARLGLPATRGGTWLDRKQVDISLSWRRGPNWRYVTQVTEGPRTKIRYDPRNRVSSGAAKHCRLVYPLSLYFSLFLREPDGQSIYVLSKIAPLEQVRRAKLLRLYSIYTYNLDTVKIIFLQFFIEWTANFKTKIQTGKKKQYLLKRRARGSTLEASVMALKTTTYTRSRLRARGTDLRTRLRAQGSTLKPSSVACVRFNVRTIFCGCEGR